ncbi:MAG: hypothetical protein WBX25_35900 [Rhodomicrobium sp.]
MSKFDVSQLDIQNSGNRAKSEAEAQNGLAYDGRRRLKVGKDKPMIFRTTAQKRDQILRLADLLSAGKPKKVSITETIELAIDALEAKLKGGK